MLTNDFSFKFLVNPISEKSLVTIKSEEAANPHPTTICRMISKMAQQHNLSLEFLLNLINILFILLDSTKKEEK